MALAFAITPLWGQDVANTAREPSAPQSAEQLYLQLRSVGLDKARVYHARDISFDRGAIHITLDDGTIAFTEDVAGRVTGAFFEGEGEVLLSPPDQVERASMALFTGAAILEESFVTAYFRFNDNTYAELLPGLRPADHAEEFVAQWNQTARNLAAADALRLLITASRFLNVAEEPRESKGSDSNSDRFLRVMVQGRKLGAFDLYFDSTISEQIHAGQLRSGEAGNFYDVWTSFSIKPGSHAEEADGPSAGEGPPGEINISRFKIRAEIKPPTYLDADATLQMEVHHGGQRAVLFELSRSLQIDKVEADGRPVEFIHNPAIEGTRLARRGNDLVAVVFPQPLRAGQQLELRFVYRGQVLSEAGNGLLYVGARGTWYPNRGIDMSNFDMEFHYPAGWTLLATGKRVPMTSASNSAGGDTSTGGSAEQVTHWVSTEPIPIAGFNLGKYSHAVAQAGNVVVEAYATRGMEHGFPRVQAEIPPLTLPRTGGMRPAPIVVPPPQPSPARNEQLVADVSARAIEFFAHRFGPFPYSNLALTQMPGELSQGWPGLIFLSSYAFLTNEEKADLHIDPLQRIFSDDIIAHETAHQWWGDSVIWEGYRDQWIVESLAEYSSLMLLESQDPSKFHLVMTRYRDDLLEKNKDDMPLMDAGPVTLGTRLSCSHFPRGYEAISYGRGTWLFHMLRTMMEDAQRKSGARRHGGQAAPDDPFVLALRKLRERYQGKSITTRELLHVFEENLPPALWFDGKKSLDWFYQSWVNGTAVPRLELQGVKYADRPASTTVSGTILQKDAPDDLVTSVPLYGTAGGKSVLLGRVFADGTESTFHLTAPVGTRKVVLDPNQTVLARTR